MGSRAIGHRAGHRRRAAGALVTVACVAGLSCATATPAIADENVPLNSGECKFGTDNIKETPWSLQRLLIDQMWAKTKGQGVKVAVIDTGVDRDNGQIRPALGSRGVTVAGGGKADQDVVGHGTKVAGIIAAQKIAGSGFFGIAPGAKVIPFKTTNSEKGSKASDLATAIRKAVAADVDVINISQGTGARKSDLTDLQTAVDVAERHGILIVASAGNDGADGREKDMYPAAYSRDHSNVLAVAASDRNNERAPFSQSGTYVNIAAPGVNMVSTVPDGGNCVDQGTSFASPYAAGAAALLIAQHKHDKPGGKWSPQEVIWHLEKTAARVKAKRDDFTGWGVVDPVAALNDTERPTASPTPDKNKNSAAGLNIRPVAITLGESEEERSARIAVYIVGGGILAVGVVVGSAVAMRDWRRKNSIGTNGEASHG
ncbi:S8 family serine peptidase [Streptomyces sp. NPDC048650]|uniref:S8 family serine peptidase n=1 Tax=Streptomyces sp. NPDC048650 TaxID=3365583 RepID=UPI00372146D1